MRSSPPRASSRTSSRRRRRSWEGGYPAWWSKQSPAADARIRGRTRLSRASWGPHSRANAPIRGPSAPGPARLPLLEERFHALVEVLAHVAHQDQVPVGAFWHQAVADPPQRFLRGLDRQRRVRCDLLCKLLGARQQRILVGRHLVEEPAL